MNAIERMEALANPLERCAVVFKERRCRASTRKDPATIVMQRAFDFAGNTLHSIVVLLRERKDVPGSVTLCRSLYELALRIRWASQHEDGWERFLMYFADQERHWARHAGKLRAFKDAGERILCISEGIFHRTGPDGRRLDAMPRQMNRVLQDIKRRDLEEGFVDEADDEEDFEYRALYQIMCRPAHGNLFPLLEQFPAPGLQHVVIGAAIAIFSMLRATWRLIAATLQEEKERVESEGHPIIEIIRGSQDLTLDDLDDEA